MSADLTVTPLTPSLGAVIGGVDIRDPGAKAMALIRRTLSEYSVIYFRGQRLGVDELETFSRRFGPMVRVPYIRPLEDHPNVIAVLKEAGEKWISTFGGEWHSDFSYLELPPVYTLLYAEEVPRGRGDTLWADMSAAYESLSPALQSRLCRLNAMHSGHIYGAARPPGARTSRSIGISRNNPEADMERAHPVVRVHPESTRKALFVNPVYTTRFEGMSEEESRPLLSFLYRHATGPAFVCRFGWEPGSLAVWDNRCTMHFAVNDYDGYRRLLYRTTVGSEQP
jgi:taurine dioxygenase